MLSGIDSVRFNVNMQPPDASSEQRRDSEFGTHDLRKPLRPGGKNELVSEESDGGLEEGVEQELSGGAAPKQCECSCKIRNIAIQCWESSGYTELKKLDCDFESGVVYLRGIVSSFYYKQLAQETIRHIEGINRIINEIVVSKPK